MQRVSSGYTIIEVIIVLAISGFLLIASSAFISGSAGHNRFSQSMRDTQSKIQDWLNDIPTGFAGGSADTADLTCKKQGNNPNFKHGGPDKGDCIYLGRAIQFTDHTDPAAVGQAADQDSTIFSYSVFGLRTFQPPPPEDVRAVANLSEANPIAAVDINSYSGDGDFTEQYTIPGGARVKQIMKPDAGDGILADSHLAGFYLGFNQLLTTATGSASLKAYQYPLPGNHVAGNQAGFDYKDVDGCISMDNSGSADCRLPAFVPEADWPPPLSEWQICFDNDYNGDTAILTISSNSGQSASTKLEFKEC